MPLMLRRTAIRAGLATAGTVFAAIAVRKLIPPSSGLAASPGPGPPGLLTLRALTPVMPRVALPSFAWTAVAPDGSTSQASLAGHAGQGVVLNLWATWCDPCVREMPSLARLAASLRPHGVAVLPVSIDRAGAPAVRAFYRAHAITDLPVLLDPEGHALSSLSLGAIPVTFVIDRAGRIAGKLEGGADWSEQGAAARVLALIG